MVLTRGRIEMPRQVIERRRRRSAAGRVGLHRPDVAEQRLAILQMTEPFLNLLERPQRGAPPPQPGVVSELEAVAKLLDRHAYGMQAVPGVQAARPIDRPIELSGPPDQSGCQRDLPARVRRPWIGLGVRRARIGPRADGAPKLPNELCGPDRVQIGRDLPTERRTLAFELPPHDRDRWPALRTGLLDRRQQQQTDIPVAHRPERASEGSHPVAHSPGAPWMTGVAGDGQHFADAPGCDTKLMNAFPVSLSGERPGRLQRVQSLAPERVTEGWSRHDTIGEKGPGRAESVRARHYSEPGRPAETAPAAAAFDVLGAN